MSFVYTKTFFLKKFGMNKSILGIYYAEKVYFQSTNPKLFYWWKRAECFGMIQTEYADKGKLFTQNINIELIDIFENTFDEKKNQIRHAKR